MEWYHATLITMAIIAAALAWRVSGAVSVVSLGSFFYILSVWLHQAMAQSGASADHIEQLQHFSTAFGAATNFFMCRLLYSMPKEAGRWVDKVFSCYILMLLIDLLYVCGVIKSHYIFAVSLEIVNAYALLLIWAAGIAERAANGRSPNHSHGDFLDSFNRAVLAPRKEYPKWWRHP